MNNIINHLERVNRVELLPGPYLPEWLSAANSKLVKRSEPTQYELLQLELLQFEIIFMSVLEKVAEGQTTQSIFNDDHRGLNHSKFIKWIHKDAQRKAMYYEAQEIGAEIIAGEMIDIADAKNSLEDVQRSTLRINTRKYLLGIWNKRRFGEVKQVEVGGTISIVDALTRARNRLIEGELVDNYNIEYHDSE